MDEGVLRLYPPRRFSTWMLVLQATIIYFLISPTHAYVPLLLKSQQLWHSTLQTITNKFVPTAQSTASVDIRTDEGQHRVLLSALKEKYVTDEPVAFIIERFDRQNTDNFNEVSDLCIAVFFDEKAEVDKPPSSTSSSSRNGFSQTTNVLQNFLLSFSLKHLKDMQEKDLRTRKLSLSENQTNEMIIAREVFPCSSRGFNKKTNDKKLLSSGTRIYNVDCITTPKNAQYTLGAIIGFVEVTSKPFALGRGDDYTETGRLKGRPVLSNLCVKRKVRKSGVGSALLEACEKAVTTWSPSYNEIVLLVEEDNLKAQKFYERRGYETVFSDPTSRRYEASGFFVTNVRTTKNCMYKKLSCHSLWNRKVENRINNFNLLRFLGQAGSSVAATVNSR